MFLCVCVCVFVPCALAALCGVSAPDDPSEEALQLGAPAGGDCEASGSTQHHQASAPPAGEESDCGTDGGGHINTECVYVCVCVF